MSNFLTVRNNRENISHRLSTVAGVNNNQPSENLDNLLKDVAVHWKELIKQDANTLDIALALMDSSSIGRARYKGNFEQLQEKLRQTLKSHVIRNYQGFSEAIGNYADVVKDVRDSQSNINSTKELLGKARVELATRRPVLKDLRSKSLRYKEMIQILEMVEHIKGVPDLLASQIAQKHFLTAFNTLTEARNMAEENRLNQIGALQNTFQYLATQEGMLFNILMEELSSHLYLKSPYTDVLWSSYSSGRDDTLNLEQVVEDKIRFDMFKESASSYSGSSLLMEFLEKFDKSKPMEEDAQKNVETDSYSYIQLLIETLAKMNRLGSTFVVLQQRLATELHQVIEKTIAEVKQRSPKELSEVSVGKTLNIFRDFEEANDQARLSIIQDFIWTLYSKLIAVLQAHRVIYEVSRGIYSRHLADGKANDAALFAYDMQFVYETTEKTIQSLMFSYVAGNDKPGSRLDQAMHRTDTSTSHMSARNKVKPLFRFEQVDYARDDYISQYDTLNNVLEQSVPGLIQTAPVGNAKSKLLPYTALISSASHELLVQPVIFNIRVMIEPTVVFLQRVKSIFPYNDEREAQKLGESFLDSFMSNFFLPELESSLRYSYDEIVNSTDSFIPDPQWLKESKKPVLYAVTEFLRLMHTTCHLLSTGYMFREKYAAVIISTIKWLAETFKEKFYELVERTDEANKAPAYSGLPLKMAAILAANDPTMGKILKVLRGSSTEKEKEAALAEEVAFYTEKRHSQRQVNGGVKQSDLLDIDLYYQIALLASSLRWLVIKLKKIRKVKEPEPQTEPGSNSLQTRARKRWTLLEATRSKGFSDFGADNGSALGSEACNLILAGKSLTDFDNAVKGLEELANDCIAALRADVRLRTIYYMDLAFTQGEYYLDSDSEERDSSIGLLDSAILKCDDNLSETLTDIDKGFVFFGLAQLMNELLVKEGDSLDFINQNGVIKMKYNILALQQMLKSIVSDPNQVVFDRARAFYDKMKLNPNKLMELVRTKPAGLDCSDFKILNRLIYSGLIRQNEDAGRKELASATRNQCIDQQMNIHKVYWGNM